MAIRLLILALAGAATASQAASVDHYLTIEGISRETPAGPIYLKVTSSGDLDGDGAPDAAILRLTCTGGQAVSAQYQVTGPRDAASGMPTGKRQHNPIRIVKQWGAATPQLARISPGYNVKENKGARTTSAYEGWRPIQLSGASGLCPAAQSASMAAGSATGKKKCLIYQAGHEGDDRYCSQSVPDPK